MGTDKALMNWVGEPMWLRQLRKLKDAHPASLCVAVKSDCQWRFDVSTHGAEVLCDEGADCGPLGGVLSALRYLQTDYGLFLAVDLPAVPVDYLRDMQQAARARCCGLVATSSHGLEPLVAVYPKAALEFAESQIAAGQYALHAWIQKLEGAGLLGRFPGQDRWFANINTPGEWETWKNRVREDERPPKR